MPAKVDYGPLCNFDGCEKPPAYRFRGLCRSHYAWVNKGKEKRVLSLWSVDIKPGAAHRRCRILWGRAAEHTCIECGNEAYDWAYDGTDSSQLYADNGNGTWTWFSRFPEFYMPMCRSCHRKRDGSNQKSELHAYRMSFFSPQHQELVLARAGAAALPDSYVQNARTVTTRSRKSRGMEILNVRRRKRPNRHPRGRFD